MARCSGWLFVTFPTIASVGWNQDFSRLFRGKTLADSTLLHFLAHEFGHYYFGTLLRPNATLRYFFSESTTEYLVLKATQHQLGPRLYREKLAGYRQRMLRHGNFPGLADVRPPDEVDDAYRYVAAPLQLLALERQIGEKHMWRWLRLLALAAPARTDYAFLLSSLHQSGLPDSTLPAWARCFTGGGAAMQQALLELTQPEPPSSRAAAVKRRCP